MTTSKALKGLVLITILALTGCASATPIDILIPTRKPSAATQEYLGHLYQTNNANRLYHSLVDTKVEKAMIPLRNAELKGLKIVAQGEIELYERMGDATSKGVWGGIIALAGLAGWQIPRPQEKGKVTEALHKQPPE